MAKVISGPMLGVSGTFGGFTYSQQADGSTTVKSKNKKRTTAATPKQLVLESDTQIFAKFMKPLKSFVKVGYELEAKKLGMNPNNAMVKCTRKVAVQGVYPNRSIDYSKMEMSKGSLPAADASVTRTDTGLAFSWDTTLIPNVTHYSDQVIMLAYFPALKETRYVTGGAQRYLGNDFLVLEGIKKGFEAEIYISFVTNDRRAISNSVHLGQLIW